MLQTGLAAAFGFFAAIFLVLLLAPGIARRISDLTWRQAQRVLPQSSEEIAAARDHIRGQNAIEMRQLEMKMEAVAEKERLLRIGKQGYETEIQGLKAQGEQLNSAIAALENANSSLTADLSSVHEARAVLATDLADRDVRLAAINAELSQLRGDHARQIAAFGLMDEAHKQVSQRLDTARNEASQLRSKLSSAESELRIARTEAKRHENDAKLANRKIAALEGKLERSIRLMAEAEEKLGRREAEIKRNKEQPRPATLAAPAHPSPTAPQILSSRLQTVAAAPLADGAKSDVIASQTKALRPALRIATSATIDEKRQLKGDMMDLAGRITAEAAAENPQLQAKIMQLQPNGSALSEAILKYTKQAAE